MRLLHALLLTSVFILSACSKTKENPPAPVAPPVQAQNVTCGSEDPKDLLSSLAAKETERDGLEKATHHSPAKENFRKLYEAQISYVKDAAEVLAKLNTCSVKVPDFTIQELKKKVAKAQADVTYMADSFPDFK